MQASNTKPVRARISHKGTNNPLKHEEPASVQLISYSTTAPLSTPCLLEDRNHTWPWGNSLTWSVSNPVSSKTHHNDTFAISKKPYWGKGCNIATSSAWSCLLWWQLGYSSKSDRGMSPAQTGLSHGGWDVWQQCGTACFQALPVSQLKEQETQASERCYHTHS